MIRPVLVKPDGDVVDDDVNTVEGKKGNGVSKDPNCNSGKKKANHNKHIIEMKLSSAAA